MQVLSERSEPKDLSRFGVLFSGLKGLFKITANPVAATEP